jgi:DeoR/GlpR family transcriptional regulator of sugar metabolism
VADSTKIGKNAFASLGALSLINYLITDSKIKKEDIEWLKTYDVQFIIANE